MLHGMIPRTPGTPSTSDGIAFGLLAVAILAVTPGLARALESHRQAEVPRRRGLRGIHRHEPIDAFRGMKPECGP